MRKLISGIVFTAIALSVPAAAAAQRRTAPAGGARHEIGVDIGVAYQKPDGFDGGIVIGTPVDLRVGFVSRTKIMWEPRLTLNFNSVGGSSDYIFTPGVNVLYANSAGGHRNGMYIGGGAGLVLADILGTSGTSFQLNAGVGWRKPQGSSALRYEVGFRWTSESDITTSTIEIGGRIGLSLWR